MKQRDLQRENFVKSMQRELERQTYLIRKDIIESFNQT